LLPPGLTSDYGQGLLEACSQSEAGDRTGSYDRPSGLERRRRPLLPRAVAAARAASGVASISSAFRWPRPFASARRSA
jgi:hypothetical protein